MRYKNKFLVIFYIFIFTSLILIPFVNFEKSNILNNLNLKNQQYNKDYSIGIESTNSIDSIGTGSFLKGEEYAWNDSSKQGLINGDSVTWNIPNAYSGKLFWVKVENLTANVTLNSYELADNYVINKGSWTNGTMIETYYQDNSYFRVDGPNATEGIDVDFQFNIAGISKANVTSIDWYVVGRRNSQNIQIRMWNDTSSSYINVGTISASGSWGTYYGTINGNNCFANVDPRIILNFNGPSFLGLNNLQLDYIYVRVYYTSYLQSVNPEDINFQVQLDTSNYPVLSVIGNATTIPGNWVGPISKNFIFLSSSPSNFDIKYTRLLNKTKDAYTYYYLANNENVNNTWKVNYTAGPIPSDYQKLNFTVQLPKDWKYLNTTAPNGNNHTIYTTTDNSGSKLLVSVNSTAVDLFKSQLPSNWSIWANSSNYISQIQFFKYPNFTNPMISPIIYNLTQNMTIKCPLNSPTISPLSANLTIFNGTDQIVHQELQVSVSGNTIIFTGWNTSEYNQNGQYKAQITWFNGTQIGFRNASFFCVYPTNIQMVQPTTNQFDWGNNRTLNITVRYLNTFNQQGISGAYIAQYIWEVNPSINLTDKLDGTYNFLDSRTNVTLGIHYITMNFSKYGYYNLTNYQITVNIVNDTDLILKVENFSGPYIDPTLIKSYFPENITITANYTQLWVFPTNPLDNAIVNVSIDTKYINDMIPQVGQPGIYYLLLNSTSVVQSLSDIGQHNITVTAWKSGYFAQQITFKWEILETSTSITSNTSIYAGYGGTPFKINIYYNNTYHNYKYNISDANFSIKYDIDQILYNLYPQNITNYGNGSYDLNLIFNIYNINYNFQMNITANRTGYQPRLVLIDMTIWVYNTSIVWWDYNDTIPLYSNQTINLGFNRSISENLTFPIGVQPDLDVKINQSYGFTWKNTTESGNYTITLITAHEISNLNSSSQYVNISLNKTNHQVQSLAISFKIRENHTFTSLANYTKEGNYYRVNIYLNQTMDLFANYINDEVAQNYNLANETNDNVNITIQLFNATNGNLIGYYNASQYTQSMFNLTIITSQYNLLIGDYFLNVSLKKLNYEMSFIFINLTVKPWESNLTAWDQFSGKISISKQWQYQSISFSSRFFKTIFNISSPRTGIDELITNSTEWSANVNFTIKDLINQTIKSGAELFYNIISKLWELVDAVSLRTDANNPIMPGNYRVWLNSSAKNIVPMIFCFDLIVLDWLPSQILLLPLQPEISETGQLLLSLQFSINGTTSGGSFMIRNLNLKLFLVLEGGLPIPLELTLQTSSNGGISATFPISPGVKSIIYWFEFKGVNASMPAWSIEPSQSIPNVTMVTSIWTLLLPIIIGVSIGIASILIFYTLNRRVRVKRQSKVMEEAEKTFEYFSDLISIRKIYVIGKKSETAIYQQNYNSEDFDEFTNKALINMINGYGKGESGYRASLDLIRYQDLFILIDDGDFVRVAFILSKIPSNKFLKGMVRFLQFFEINNYLILKKDGQFSDKSIIDQLLDNIFEISIILPYRVTMKGMNMKLSAFRSQLVMTAYENSPEGYFFISILFNKIHSSSMMPELMIFKEISYLIDKQAFVIYSLKELKEKGQKIKYISGKEIKPPEPVEKLKAPSKVEKASPIEQEEEYITPTTARIMEDYEFPESTQYAKVMPEEEEPFEGFVPEEERLAEEMGEITPFELIAKKEFEKLKIEEKEEIPKIEQEEVEIPEEKKALLKKILEQRAIEEVEERQITEEEVKEEEIEVTKKPISIKPIPKPIPIKPFLPTEEVAPTPEILIPKPGKMIEISEFEEKEIDKSLINVISDINKLSNSLNEIEKYIGKSVQEIVTSKKKIDYISTEILNVFESSDVILQKEIGDARSKIKESEKTVEKLLFYLIDIEKELEKSDKEYEKISHGVKKIEKKLEKRPKAESESVKLGQIREKLVEIDEKISKSLEVREKFEIRINESAKKVEKVDDIVKIAENKVKSAHDNLDLINKDIQKDLTIVKHINEKRNESQNIHDDLDTKKEELNNLLLKVEADVEVLNNKAIEAENIIMEIFTKKVESAEEETAVPMKKPTIPKVAMEKQEVEELEQEQAVEESEEKLDISVSLGMEPHCPVCHKIIPEKVRNLLIKGFTPECPLCGSILNPNDFEL